MAKTIALEKNPRIKSVTTLELSKNYYKYDIELNDTFYRGIYSGDVHCSIKGYSRIEGYEAIIQEIKAKKPEDHARVTIEMNSTTLSYVHDSVNALLGLADWEKNKAQKIETYETYISQEKETLARNERYDRESAIIEDTSVFSVILSGASRGILTNTNAVRGMIGSSCKAITESNQSIAEWKEQELTRLKAIQTQLMANIDLVESIDTTEATKWFNDLQNQCKTYIEKGN